MYLFLSIRMSVRCITVFLKEARVFIHSSQAVCFMVCGLWLIRKVDTACHVLFRCKAVAHTRLFWWGKIIETMPPAMVLSIDAMGDSERLTFILSGLKCERIVPAWSDVMVNIGKFVYFTYQHRKKEYDGISQWVTQTWCKYSYNL